MLTEIVHNTKYSNYTILFFILFMDDYDFWYTNEVIIQIHLIVKKYLQSMISL